MSGGGPPEKVAEMDWLAHERFLHEINIPDETRKQRAEGEEDADAVRAEGVSLRHGSSDEGRPQSHQDARHDARDDALLRNGAVRVGEAAVGFAIQYDGDYRANDTGGKQPSISVWLKNIARDDAHDESDTDGNGEGDG